MHQANVRLHPGHLPPEMVHIGQVNDSSTSKPQCIPQVQRMHAAKLYLHWVEKGKLSQDALESTGYWLASRQKQSKSA